ncbi:MAG: response regulator [Nitrosomonas sp.]|nr:response regulator [Nitrosomonas sp.]
MFFDGSEKLKILLIEDEERWRETFKYLIAEEQGIELIEATRSNEALTFVRQHSDINLVVMDYKLNEDDLNWGFELNDSNREFEFCERILECNKKIRIVMWSVTSNFLIKAHAKDIGCCGFIDKMRYEDRNTFINSIKKIVRSNRVKWVEIPEGRDIMSKRKLNEREIEIVIDIANGHNQEWIARKKLHQVFKKDFVKRYAEFANYYKKKIKEDEEDATLNGAYEAFCHSPKLNQRFTTSSTRKSGIFRILGGRLGNRNDDSRANGKPKEKKSNLEAERHVLNNQISALKEKLMEMFQSEFCENDEEMHLFRLAQLASREFLVPINKRQHYCNLLSEILDFHFQYRSDNERIDKAIEYFIFERSEKKFKKEKMKKWLLDIRKYREELPLDESIEKHQLTKEKLFKFINSDDFLKGL